MKSIIEKLKIHNRIRVAYVAAFFLLLICCGITLFINSRLVAMAEHVDNTNKTIVHLEALLSGIKDGETGVQGYFATKDTQFLKPWYGSKSRTDSTFNFLRSELSTAQKPRIDTLSQLVERKFLNLQEGISLFRNNQQQFNDTLLAKAGEGRLTMDSIRALVLRMQAQENINLEERKIKVQQRFHALNSIIYGSLIITLLLLVFGFITYMLENKARQAADKKVEQYQDQLRERILELRNVNKELLQMRSIEKFAATGRIARTIAHEVRNPLTNINLAMEQLKTELDPNEDTVILFEMVQRNSNRINQLITDLLNSTKFAELSYGKVSINKIMDDALDLAKDRIALYNITIKKQYSADICDVAVDTDKMKIAFLNIIVNAIEAMEPGKGVLTIITRAENNKCIIEIADNGSGMDKESMSRLFEPYFTSKPKGNGLGLTNTQNIVLNHKGIIQADSEQGKGTMFSIALDFAE